MTTLCLEDLSERDFAALSQLPRIQARSCQRIDGGRTARSPASTMLSERLPTPAAPAMANRLHVASAW